MSNYLYIPGLVIINELISTIIQFAAAAVMQLQQLEFGSNAAAATAVLF